MGHRSLKIRLCAIIYLHPSDVMNDIETALITPVAAVTLFSDEMVTLYNVFGDKPLRVIASVNDLKYFAPY